MSDFMLIGILNFAICFIVVAITALKIHAFLALSLASILVAVLSGIPLQDIGGIIEKGIGGTLGFLAVIIGCGSILGKMLEISGGAKVIADSLLSLLGRKRADMAMMLVGFIAGIPVFVEVGFVLLVPLVLVVAKQMQISRIKLGMALGTSLMCVHCLLPPHPAATTIVSLLGADIARVIIYALIIGIICAFCGSILYLRLFSFSHTNEVADIAQYSHNDGKKPGLLPTYFTILLPLILMLSKMFSTSSFIGFISNPIVALLISVFVAYYTLGIRLHYTMKELLDISSDSFLAIASVLLIIGAGGAFNEVLIQSNIGEALKNMLSNFSLNPILLAWLIAIILHASVGSATVAMISAAGIVLSLDTDISKEVLCLAIGSGAIGCTIVTDSLFWLVKENLKMSMKEMFIYFTGATAIASVAGLITSFILASII